MPPTPAQLHLNGAYYGPPIHPKPYHRTCNPLTCCLNCICGCIFNLIFQLLLTIAIILAITGLTVWFIFRPNVPKFYVNNVTMTQFTLSPTNNTLLYNLAVNMTFRNPNRRLGICYDQIDVNTVYHGMRFATANMQGFCIGHKKENDVSAVFKGQQLVVDGYVYSRYDSETSDEELYRIDLKLRLKMRFKVLWMIKTPKFKPRFECDLKVPLSDKGRVSSVEFERTECDFVLVL